MPWIPAAIAAAGAIGSAIMGSSAQDKALQAQQQSAQAAMDLQNQQWKTEQENQAPWLAAGRAALPELQRIAVNAGNINPTADAAYRQKTSLVDPGQFSFNTTGENVDPSYAWRLSQGLNAVNSSAAARGGFFSGNTGVALNDYAQNAASQEYQNQFGRYNTTLGNYMNQEAYNADQYNQAYNRQMGIQQNAYNQFAGLAGIGQTAVNQVGNVGANYANNTGNIGINNANNAATAYVNNSNIWGNAIQDVSNQFASAWGQQQQLNALNNKPLGPAY